MFATDNAKPPRPCTEYNIFFQLERAYILQVILQSEPSPDGTDEAFHSSQPTYKGLPALPPRYASLVLAYDFFLPGKEQRRKRKHRRSHGAISFHDLSTRVANAWKSVDNDIKRYCSQVCAVGMIRYKAAMKEWRRKEGGQSQRTQGTTQSRKTQRQKVIAKMSSQKKVSDTDESAKKKKAQPDMSMMPIVSSNSEPAQAQENQTQPVQHLPVFSSQNVSMEELNRTFENDILGMFDMHDPLFPPCDGKTDAAQTVNTFETSAPELNVEGKGLRNALIVSNGPVEQVDMDDKDIIDMWTNNSIPISAQSSSVPANQSSYAPSNAITNQFVVDADEFGLKGYAQTMKEVYQMNSKLEQHLSMKMNLTQTRTSSNSMLARSA